MSASTTAPISTEKKPAGKRRRRGAGAPSGHSLMARGEPALWLMGGSMLLALAMIVGLLGLICWQGLQTFWPRPVIEVTLLDGTRLMGEVTRQEKYEPTSYLLASLSDEARKRAEAAMQKQDGKLNRRLLRTGNFDLTRSHFHWVNNFDVEEETKPTWALLIERVEWGRFYGTPDAFVIDGKTVATEPEKIWVLFNEHHEPTRDIAEQIDSLLYDESSQLSRQQEDARLASKQAALDFGEGSPQHQQALEHAEDVNRSLAEEIARINDQVAFLKNDAARYQLVLKTASGETQGIQVADIVRAFPPNQLSTSEKLGVYSSRWYEFLSADPREANSEGGVFPAIWGTVVMTLIMSLAVVPFGVLAALYLREYAKAGPVVSAIRIAINNLAGVPSIVFGVFGMGFFCYIVGGYIDGGPENARFEAWPRPIWFITAGALALTACGAFACGLLSTAARKGEATTTQRVARLASWTLWIVATCLLLAVFAKTPYFRGFYEANLPNPTFAKGGLLWASLTLALLTLPVVIVATEEALSAVPNSMREGSYACGASKWQTIRRIVLPRALPGMMTGMILAMARGAGEVAPLMLVGAVKIAPELPLDGRAPFFHPERSFMHLGFHIFDLGFQSQNSEAAKPMVFTTTLLLLLLIAVLNLFAIWLRARLRRRFISIQF